MKTIFVNNLNLTIVQQTAPACVMALGFFDGVHIGHQKVIETARAEAKRKGLPLALMSFATHPINVLSNGQRKVDNLMTLCSKQEKLQQLGVELFYLVDFTMPFANLTPEEFVHEYLLKLNVKHAVAGFDYCYGKMGAGKLHEIPALSNNHITVTKVDCLDFKGEKVSSTAIRHRLQDGLVHEIPNILGHPFRNRAEIKKQLLVLVEDTMLPAVGRYRVNLIQDKKKSIIEVSVESNHIIQCLQLPILQGEVFIEWVENIPLKITKIV